MGRSAITTPRNVVSELLVAKAQPFNKELTELGTRIGKLYTDMGFPPDMAIERLEGYSREQFIVIIDGLCLWLIEHKHNSGATEKAIERQRNTNREMLERFISTGELGVY